MKRACWTGLLFLAAAGCQLPAERLPLKPLPEDGQPVTYGELTTRARLQATAATEAFYIDKWSELEDAARALELTARLFTKATEVPGKHKDQLVSRANDLGKDAGALRDAARGKDAKRTNEVLQRIHLQVRELRADE